MEKVIVEVVVGIFSESWCATPMHRGRLGVLLLTDEARLFLIDLARLKCLLGQAFEEALLLLNKLFLFLCFFSLGAEFVYSGNEGLVHLQTTLLNKSFRFRWIFHNWLSFGGIWEFCQIDFLCHNETVILNALSSFFCCKLDLDSVLRGVLLSIPALKACVF